MIKTAGTALLFSLALLPPCAMPGAEADESSWIFHPDRIEGGRVKPMAGSREARIEGTAQYATSPTGLGALAINGKDNAIIVSDDPGELASLPTGNLTLEGWVLMRSRKEWSGIVGAFQDNGDYERGFVLGCHKDNFYFGLATRSTGKMTHLQGSTVYQIGKWYHVVARYDWRRGRSSLWVNGKLDAQSDEPGGKILLAPSGFFEIGSYHDDNEYFRTEGMIHEIGVYSSAMSKAEIARRYRAKEGKLPPAPREIYGPFSEVFGPFVEFTDRETIAVTWETPWPSKGSLTIRTQGARPLILEEADTRTSHRIVVPGIKPETLYRYRLHCRAAGRPELMTAEYEFDSTFNYAPHPEPIARNPFRPDEWSAGYRDTARRIIESAGGSKGYCLVLDSGEGRLAYHLAKLSQWRIVAIEKDPELVRKSRAALDSAGLYGSRVSVHQPGGSLPFGPYFANVICSDSMLRTGRLPAEPANIYRLLRPCGGILAFGRWAKAAGKPILRQELETWLKNGGGDGRVAGDGKLWIHARTSLPGAGDWTHQYGLPDNSACNYDQRVGGKLKVLWWGRPGPRAMPDRGPRNPAPVSANGRLFVQGMRVLFGLDAYNGTILWSKQIPTMRRANMPRGSSNMVATDDILYVVVGSQCAGFDAQTGKLLLKTGLPFEEKSDHEWGYLAASGELLIGSTTRKGGNYLGDDGQWFEDFKKEETAKVVSDGLFALDRKTGTKRWAREQGTVINSTITVSNGVVYFVESRNPEAGKKRAGRLQNEIRTDQYIVALNLDSGSFLWDKKADFSKCEFTTYMSHHGDTLLVSGTDKDKNYHTYAFDTSEREALWDHHTNARKTHHSGHLMHPVIIDDRIYLNKHTLDLRSGAVLKVDPFDYHGCGTMSASARAIFHRIEYHGMLDLETGKRTEFVGVRGSCWLGQIPAGGLLLAPESGAGCSCTHAIQTSMAFVPEDD